MATGDTDTDIERIETAEGLLALILRCDTNPDRTSFFTPEDIECQVGFVVHPRGHEIPRHTHKSVRRKVNSTWEVLLVKRGRCEVDIYDGGNTCIATRRLNEGDIIIFIAGGHGFRMLEDTVLFEVKQGPYLGAGDKQRF